MSKYLALLILVVSTLFALYWVGFGFSAVSVVHMLIAVMAIVVCGISGSLVSIYFNL